MTTLIDVTYVSVWDGGTEIETNAQYDPETKQVTNIQVTEGVDADGDEVQTLEGEFIVLPDGEKLDVFEYDGEYMTEPPVFLKNNHS